jgi:hypothetical protein
MTGGSGGTFSDAMHRSQGTAAGAARQPGAATDSASGIGDPAAMMQMFQQILQVLMALLQQMAAQSQYSMAEQDMGGDEAGGCGSDQQPSTLAMLM